MVLKDLSVRHAFVCEDIFLHFALMMSKLILYSSMCCVLCLFQRDKAFSKENQLLDIMLNIILCNWPRLPFSVETGLQKWYIFSVCWKAERKFRFKLNKGIKNYPKTIFRTLET